MGAECSGRSELAPVPPRSRPRNPRMCRVSRGQGGKGLRLEHPQPVPVSPMRHHGAVCQASGRQVGGAARRCPLPPNLPPSAAKIPRRNPSRGLSLISATPLAVHSWPFSYQAPGPHACSTVAIRHHTHSGNFQAAACSIDSVTTSGSSPPRYFSTTSSAPRRQRRDCSDITRRLCWLRLAAADTAAEHRFAMDSYKNECRGYNLHDAVEDAKLSSTASTVRPTPPSNY